MRTTKLEADRLERLDALEQLREMLPPGSTVYTVLRHVSRDGMSRDISPIVFRDSEPLDLTWLVHVATGVRLNSRSSAWNAIRVGGCGMDMGFHLVHELSSRLYPDGFDCAGKGCHSNDHTNGDRDYTPGPAHRHASGGYALAQRWL